MRAAACLLAIALAGSAQSIRGFRPDRVTAQRALETRLMKIPSGDRAKEYMRRMSAEPHHAGSAGSKAVAQYAAGLFREWGLTTEIEEFDALLPHPTERLVEMVRPLRRPARRTEPRLAADPDSADQNQVLPYNAYSADGDVTAEVVYVNYGTPEDYRKLAEMRIDVRGKLVIARYGRVWRGTKVKVAAEHGAAGCLLYSDPRDDGYWQGDPFPDGAFRPLASVQRGSVMDMPLHVGDPLTPGWPSLPGTRRLTQKEAATLMPIPVLPISAEDARPILAELRGPVAPPDWRGALPQTYHVGPGPAQVHLKVASDWSRKPVYNVVARIEGSEFPDEWIVYGNHHDAWVNGAADPISGAVALLETARAIAELKRNGFRPRRTLIFALWDAEEFGLIGSTEWAEKHAEQLQRNTLAYLNSDMNAATLSPPPARPDSRPCSAKSWPRFLTTKVKQFSTPQKPSGPRTSASAPLEPDQTMWRFYIILASQA